MDYEEIYYKWHVLSMIYGLKAIAVVAAVILIALIIWLIIWIYKKMCDSRQKRNEKLMDKYFGEE